MKVDDPKAYLARIAWRVAVKARKRNSSRPDQDQFGDDEGLLLDMRSIGIEEAASQRELTRLVRTEIAALPADLRDAITLSGIQELSAAEAAVVLNVAEGTVRTRVFRARQLLRSKLEKVLEGTHVQPTR